MKEKEEITLTDVAAEAKAEREQERVDRAGADAMREVVEEPKGRRGAGAGRRAASPDETAGGRTTVADDGERKRRRLRGGLFGGDKALWVIIITLLIFSMLLTLSATVYKPGGTPVEKVFDQVKYILLGILLLLGVHIVKFQYYSNAARALFWIGFGLTLLPIALGAKDDGAWRGFVLPVVGIYFQPFEFLKIALVMLLAQRLARRQKNIENTQIVWNPVLYFSRDEKVSKRHRDIFWKQTIPLLGPIAITCLLTYFAVGTSTTIIIGLTCFVMLIIGRVRWQDLMKIAGVALLAGGILFFAMGAGRGQTGQNRINTHNPHMMTKFAKVNTDGEEVYDAPGEAGQAINAKMSIASGGFFGKGPGMSTHRSNLEEAEKDFAYAFIIEEYGVIGGVLILLLYLWLFFRSIQIFKKCGTAFPSLLVLGLGLMITLQAMIHMLVSVSLIPITGQQLPLISKGGSSLLFTLMALGMILGISRQTDTQTITAPKDESLFEKN